MTTGSLAPLLDDLAAEHDALDGIVGALDEPAWGAQTPAAGWTVRDQIGHLTYFDGAAARAVTDPGAFRVERDAIVGGSYDDVADAEARVRTLPVAMVLAEWRAGRATLFRVLEPVDAAARIEWYGPTMSARSFVTARLMETWAHGLDVADALAVPYTATDRLRHVAHLGVATRGWTFISHGLMPSPGDVRVELEPPTGGPAWTWGDDGVDDRVTGPALDFCQVVTQRRLLSDTSLRIVGALAEKWMANAQAFAGRATSTDPSRGRGGSST